MSTISNVTKVSGPTVTNVPDYCVSEVAYHALALLLAGARNIALATARAISSASVPDAERMTSLPAMPKAATMRARRSSNHDAGSRGTPLARPVNRANARRAAAQPDAEIAEAVEDENQISSGCGSAGVP